MSVGTENTERTREIDRMLLEIEELPTIPETLIEILRVIDDPATGAADLARIVRLDAPLSAKILRLANSPFYGSHTDISDISRCIGVLGYRTLRNVAITLTVATNLVTAVSRAGGRLDYRDLWRHSVVTGAIAKHLATLVNDPEPEEIFTGGLLHDLGKFVLALHAPEAYDRVVAQRGKIRRHLSALERDAFGFDHAEVGGAFVQSWRLPEILVRCVADHHLMRRPQDANALRAERGAAIVALADHLANKLVPSASDLGSDPSLQQAGLLHDAAGIPLALVESNVDEIRESIGEATIFVDLA